jgi:hypothetical protein
VRRPGGERGFDLVQSVDLDDHPRDARRHRAPHRLAHDPATATWLSLIIAASHNPMRWLVAPPVRVAYFSSTRSPGAVLRVSSNVAPVPAMAST